MKESNDYYYLRLDWNKKGSNLNRFNEDQQSLLCTKCLQNEQEEWQIVKTSNRTNRIVQRQSSYS